MSKEKIAREVWKKIPGYEGRYLVSDQGRIRSLTRLSPYKGGTPRRRIGRILRPQSDGLGYLQVRIHGDRGPQTHRIHQLVMLAFCGPYPGDPWRGPGRVVIDHKNRDKTDNRLGNLQYISHLENLRKDHSGERNPGSKLNNQAVAVIRHCYRKGVASQALLGRLHSIHPTAISRICRGKRWNS